MSDYCHICGRTFFASPRCECRDDIARLTAKLQAAEERLQTISMCELGATNNNVKSYMDHWESRAEAAEAMVATAHPPKMIRDLVGKLQAAEAENARLHAEVARLKGRNSLLESLRIACERWRHAPEHDDGAEEGGILAALNRLLGEDK